MPISPQIIAEKRIENTIDKLCNLIDKKLQESEDGVFEFQFLANTDPKVKDSIVEIYRNVGWSAVLSCWNDEPHKLILQNPNTQTNKSTEADKSKETENKLKSSYTKGHDEIVKVALESNDGRIQLAHAMAEPINTSLMYQSVTRKLLMMDELPVDVQPKYEYGGHGEPIYYASDRTVKPYSHDCLEDWVEFAAQVNIRQEDIENKKFYVVDQAQVRLKDSLERQETVALMKLFQASIGNEQVIQTYGETLKRAIFETIGEIETQEMLAAKIMCHPKTYRRMCHALGIDFIDESTHREILMTGLYGHIQTADVHLSVVAPQDEIYMTPMSNFLGALALPNGYLQVLPCTGENGEIGFLAKQTCMPIILNPNLIHNIKIRW